VPSTRSAAASGDPGGSPPAPVSGRLSGGSTKGLRGEHRSSGGGQPLNGAGGEGPTLGDLVASAWEGLLVAGSVACPVCRERMKRRDGHGVCSSCSTILF
jgi:hypothetical protein